jgi:hypothetical protein
VQLTKCRGGLHKFAQRRRVLIAKHTERLLYRVTTPHNVANGNTAP